MKKMIGKVIDVYIPKQYKNKNLLDVMDSINIGFKVKTEDGIKIIEVEQNEINAKILKNDIVLITEQIISNTNFVDIELYDGDDYE